MRNSLGQTLPHDTDSRATLARMTDDDAPGPAPSAASSAAPTAADPPFWGDVPIDLDVLFGALLRALRAKTGRTQAQLAAALGWDRSLVVRLESGRNTPTIHELVALERLLLGLGVLDAPGSLMALMHRAISGLEAVGARPVILPRRNAPALSPDELSLMESLIELALNPGRL